MFIPVRNKGRQFYPTPHHAHETINRLIIKNPFKMHNQYATLPQVATSYNLLQQANLLLAEIKRFSLVQFAVQTMHIKD